MCLCRCMGEFCSALLGIGGGSSGPATSAGGSSCMPRNPVTGDGVYVTPLRRSARKSRDGNPVTGTGYTADPQNNVAPIQNGIATSNMNGSEKSNDTSPAGSTKGGQQSRARVPPGGYSSGLW